MRMYNVRWIGKLADAANPGNLELPLRPPTWKFTWALYKDKTGDFQAPRCISSKQLSLHVQGLPIYLLHFMSCPCRRRTLHAEENAER